MSTELDEETVEAVRRAALAVARGPRQTEFIESLLEGPLVCEIKQLPFLPNVESTVYGNIKIDSRSVQGIRKRMKQHGFKIHKTAVSYRRFTLTLVYTGVDERIAFL